jgi:hypothetical protein
MRPKTDPPGVCRGGWGPGCREMKSASPATETTPAPPTQNPPKAGTYVAPALEPTAQQLDALARKVRRSRRSERALAVANAAARIRDCLGWAEDDAERAEMLAVVARLAAQAAPPPAPAPAPTPQAVYAERRRHWGDAHRQPEAT